MPNANFFAGVPVKFQDICKIYPPTVGDILDNEKASVYGNLLIQSQEELEDLIRKKDPKAEKIFTPFEFILMQALYDAAIKQTVIDAFKFFTHQEVQFLWDMKLIVFGTMDEILQVKQVEDLKLLKEDNFFEFQNLIREAMGQDPIELYEVDPDPRIARIKAAGRRRERAKKKSQKSGISFGTYLAAICCMGIGITPLNIREISYASVPQLVRLYQAKEKYNTDISSILAGADSKKVKPKYWIGEYSDLQQIEI